MIDERNDEQQLSAIDNPLVTDVMGMANNSNSSFKITTELWQKNFKTKYFCFLLIVTIVTGIDDWWKA